jgi:hypothetical protein
MLDEGRAVPILPDVLLARPDELDRAARRLRADRRLRHEIRDQPPAEAAAQIGAVHRDLAGRNLEHL